MATDITFFRQVMAFVSGLNVKGRLLSISSIMYSKKKAPFVFACMRDEENSVMDVAIFDIDKQTHLQLQSKIGKMIMLTNLGVMESKGTTPHHRFTLTFETKDERCKWTEMKEDPRVSHEPPPSAKKRPGDEVVVDDEGTQELTPEALFAMIPKEFKLWNCPDCPNGHLTHCQTRALHPRLCEDCHLLNVSELIPFCTATGQPHRVFYSKK